MKTLLEYIQLFGALIGGAIVLVFLGFLMFIDWIRGK